MRYVAKFAVAVLSITFITLTIWGLRIDTDRLKQEWAVREQAQFSGWSKLHPEARLTFEEWWHLKNDDLLPEQTGKRLQAEASADAFVGGAVGGMIGSQLGK
jgi:hypothetical protein